MAQDSLDTLLENGYVAHWLVCGPFPSADSLTILEKVRRGQSALGPSDFMAALGGIERIRPKHLQVVSVEGQPDAVWQRAGSDAPQLDLAPFYPKSEEGTSYAGFYAEASVATTVYVELHSTLGARMWLNGQLISVSQEPALPVAGVDRAIVTFREGNNFLVIQTPAARFDALAKAASVSPQDLSSRIFANRQLLTGASGFEIALELRPAQPLGDLYYLPKLRSTGGFSGSSGEVRQEEVLTFFNPQNARSSLVDVIIKSRFLVEPQLVRAPGIAPGDRYDMVLPLPFGSTPPGSRATVSLALVHEGETAAFDAAFNVLPQGAGGETLLLTGTRYRLQSQGTPLAELQLLAESLHAQLELAEAMPTYGFEAGTGAEWEAWFALYPEDLPRYRALCATGQGNVASQYARVDERAVSPEILARNIARGVEAAKARLGTEGFYDAWRSPGIAPQTPQLLNQADVTGIIGGLEVPHLPAVGKLLAPYGPGILFRHYARSGGATSAEGLRDLITKQRQELSAMGLDTTLQLLENAVVPPEPFMRESVEGLRTVHPAIRISGSAAVEFFDHLASDPLVEDGNFEHIGHDLLRSQPGQLIAQPELLDAYRALAARLVPLESLCVLAGVSGAEVPFHELDFLTRTLAWYSQPAYLTSKGGSETRQELEHALWEAWGITRPLESNAWETISGSTGSSPIDLPAGATGYAEFVFYACEGNVGRRVAELEINVPEGQVLAAFDDAGTRLPCRIGDRVIQTQPTSRPGPAHRVFVAFDAQPWTVQRITLATISGKAESASAELLIENNRWLLQFDEQSGDLVQLKDKSSGIDYAEGSMNRLRSIQLDAAKLTNVGEFWSNGAPLLSSSSPLSVETRRGYGWQECRISSKSGNAAITRIARLYEGLDYIELEVELNADGDSLPNSLLSIEGDRKGYGDWFGERHGAILGGNGATAFEYRTQGMDRSNPDGLHPAYRWAASLPAPSVQFGMDSSLALCPVALVNPGVEPPLDQTRELQATLVRAGVPTTVHQDQPRGPQGVWTDATLVNDANVMLQSVGGMAIAIGNAETNAFIRTVLANLSPEDQASYARLSSRGALLAAPYKVPGEQNLIVPVLLIGGADDAITASSVAAFREALDTLGYYTVPKEHRLGDLQLSSPSGRGIAALFAESRLVSFEPEGSLTLHLGATQRFSMALLPLGGDDTVATVSTTADRYSSPVLTHELTGKATGSGATAFFASLHEDLKIAAIKPAGYAIGAGAEPDYPADGVAIRAVNLASTSASGTGLTSAMNSTLLPSDLLESPIGAGGGGEEAMEVEPMEIATYWTLMRPGTAGKSIASSQPELPVYSGYPWHGRAIAPVNRSYLGVRLHIDWEHPDQEQRAFLVNHATDQTAEGEIRFTTNDAWSVGPSSLRFSLAAGESMEIPLTLTPADPGAACEILAVAQLDEGHAVYDCSRSSTTWLESSFTIDGGSLSVELVNRMGVHAYGSLELVTPASSWQSMPGVSRQSGVEPDRLPIDLPPLARQRYSFRIIGQSGFPEGTILRLESNGRYRSWEL